MGCTSCCDTREWRDLPYAHATGVAHCIVMHMHVCVVFRAWVDFDLIVNREL